MYLVFSIYFRKTIHKKVNTLSEYTSEVGVSCAYYSFPPSEVNESMVSFVSRRYMRVVNGSLRETSDPSGTAQNEQNNKPWTAPLVPGDQISDIIWRGSK